MTHDPTNNHKQPTTLTYERDNDYIYAVVSHRNTSPIAPTPSPFRNRILSRTEIEKSANVMFTNNHWNKIAESITKQLNAIVNPTKIHEPHHRQPSGPSWDWEPEYKNQTKSKPPLPEDTFINNTIAKSMLHRPEPRIHFYQDPNRDQSPDEYIARAHKESPYALSNEQRKIYNANLHSHYLHRRAQYSSDLRSYKAFLNHIIKFINPDSYPYASLSTDKNTLHLHPQKPKLTNNGFVAMDTIQAPFDTFRLHLTPKICYMHYRDTLVNLHTFEQAKPTHVEDL